MLQSSSRGGGCLPGPGGVLLGPGGASPWSGGGVLLGPGGGGSPCSRGGLPVPGGGGGGSPETPPVYRITDTCKNITLATTSLRPVKMSCVLIFLWLPGLKSSRNSSRLINPDVNEFLWFNHTGCLRDRNRDADRHWRMGCMTLCRTFYTAPEQGQSRHQLSPIVLVPFPVSVLDTPSVNTPLNRTDPSPEPRRPSW